MRRLRTETGATLAYDRYGDGPPLARSNALRAGIAARRPAR